MEARFSFQHPISKFKNSTLGMISPKGFLMWLCAAFFYGFQFIIRISPNVMANDLMSSLGVDACVLGVLVSAYYYGYSGMQIPAGLLIDRIGTRRPLTIACLLCALGCLIFATSTDITMLTVGRFLMGIGSAFGLLTCIKISSIWLHPRLISFFVGMALVLGTTGAVGGGYPLSLVIDAYGWQKANLILAVASIVLATAAYLIVRDKKMSEDGEVTASKENIFYALRGIFINPQTWLFGFYGMLMYTPLSGFADLWGGPFLIELYNIDRTTASKAISYFYIGVGVGSPLWSILLTWLQSYRKTLAMASLATLFCFMTIVYFPPAQFGSVLFLYALTGAMTSGQFLAFGGVTDINIRTRTATASGTHNMLCMLSGVILQPLIGKFLVFSSGDKKVNGEFIYSLQDFEFALKIIPVCLLISIVIVFFIKEVYVKESRVKQPRVAEA